MNTRSLKWWVAAAVLVAAGGASGCAPVICSSESSWETPQSRHYYVVRDGDTLREIAEHHQVPLDDLVAANGIANPALILPGQRLLIPGRSAAPTQGRASTDMNRTDFAWPVQGSLVGRFNSTGTHLSKGIRIQVPGRASVRASRQGRVVFADYLAGYGYTVIVDHEDGFMTVYAGAATLAVGLNETVVKGDKVAELPDLSERAFLYFEIRKDGVAENPLMYLPRV